MSLRSEGIVIRFYGLERN